jgi:hypothetical protein
MTTGVLDLPAPLFDALDNAADYLRLPALLRILIYAGACAWIGMCLYRRFSDQPRLRALRAEIAAAQRALAQHDGGFAELGVLIRRSFSASMRQLGLTLLPALFGSLPILVVLPWLSNRFDFESPAAGAPVEICAWPTVAATELRWIPATAAAAVGSGCWNISWPNPGESIALATTHAGVLHVFGPRPQSTTIGKHGMFDWLVANPDGYLPQDSPAARLSIDLRALEVSPIGPAWLRGWTFWYFAALVLVSLALKWRWRLR